MKPDPILRLLENPKRKQLELCVHLSLMELSNYFMNRNDPLQYKVNRLWRELDKIRDTPENKTENGIKGGLKWQRKL